MLRELALGGLTLLWLTGAQEFTASVTRVIDGDTIEVEIDGHLEKVRYIGIDTPEMNDSRPEVRALAGLASDANSRLVAGRRVRLELDVEERDRYGRLLAYVWVGDTLVNEVLVLEGHAAPFTFPPNVRYVDRFIAAAREARGRNGSALSGRPSGSISATEAASHVGETKEVCGFVANTRYLARGKHPTFLNLEAPYPNQALTVLIWGEDRSDFHEAPDRMFRDREICVTGLIELYRGRPQVVVGDPGAIRLLE